METPVDMGTEAPRTGCAAVGVTIASACWIMLLGLAEFGASMTTACRYNVHTPECDRWRTINSVVFFFDVIAVLFLFAALVVGSMSKKRRIRPGILGGVAVGLALIATAADVFSRSV